MSLKKLPTLEKRTLTVDGLPVRYAEAGNGKPIVLLHGWGGQIASWGLVPAILAEESRVIALDLPGFGETPVPERPWDPYDYAELVAGVLRQLGLTSPTLVGHSHGGRVSIALAARHPELIGKLVLVDSAGIVPRRTASYYTQVYGFKVARKVLSLPVLSRWREPLLGALAGRAGSSDYQAAGNPVLRATLVKCVNTDLRHLLPEIKASTLLIWGSADDATPLADGQMMEKLIPDAGLVVFDGCGHFSYLDRLDQFCRVVNHFVTH
jgi:pimeloyl-ACP methyl ester carboxylesterase